MPNGEDHRASKQPERNQVMEKRKDVIGPDCMGLTTAITGPSVDTPFSNNVVGSGASLR